LASNPAKSRTNRRTQILGSSPLPSRGSLSFHSFVSSRSFVYANARAGMVCVYARERTRNYLYPPAYSWLQMAAVAIATEAAESHRCTTMRGGVLYAYVCACRRESYMTRRTLYLGGVGRREGRGNAVILARRSVSSAASRLRSAPRL